MGMMADMLYMVGIPALVGVCVNQLSHGSAGERVAPALAPASSLLVPVIIGTNATGISSYVLHMTPALVAVTVFVGCVTVSGFAMGLGVARLVHQPSDVAVTMSFDCGIRNISAGAVLAAAYLPAGALFPVMIATLFQQFMAALVGRRMQALRGREGAGS